MNPDPNLQANNAASASLTMPSSSVTKSTRILC